VRLSIVIPVLDEAPHLESLLPELLTTCPDAEVLVVDGGSTDGSGDVAARAAGTRVVRSDRGRARQMNAGAAAASGDALLFLHADTRLPPGAAEAVLDALADPAVAYGRFDVCFDSLRPAFRLIARLMNARSRLTGICTGDQAIFVRRATFAALGGYAEIALMEDIELSRRLKRAGRLAALRLRVTTSARKWEREGVARTIVLMWTLRLLYLCGARPDRLHRWYYGMAAPVAPSRPRGSAPVVLQRAPASLAPPAPSADPLHARRQEDRRHREQDGDQEGHTEPAIRVRAELPDRDLLHDERDEHRAGPEQRSTSHGPQSSLRQGGSETNPT
jgi:rSAM/selenodomain-associated transferase 2